MTFARCSYTATATVGNRLINLQLLDASNNIIGTWQAGAAITAGLTAQELAFLPSGAARESSLNNSSLNIAIPPGLTVNQFCKIKCFDKANIDVADTFTFAFLMST